MKMENSNMRGVGFMTVFAVSGTVVLLSLQLHKRLLSDFMKKIESQILHGSGGKIEKRKKKVRFAEDVIEPASNNEEYRKRQWTSKVSKFRRKLCAEELGDIEE